MKLAINIGNTHVWCALEDYGMLRTEHFTHHQFEKGIAHFLGDEFIQKALIASVVPSQTERVRACLEALSIQNIELLNPVALQENYEFGGWPGIGMDRLMLAAGSKAWNGDVLVCDFGTAITLNHIKNQKILSGFILPGFTMSAKALHESTGLLPQVSFHQECVWSPQTTISNIQSGIILSSVAFIEAIAKEKNALIIITGGHAQTVQPYFKETVVYEPNLLIKGMLELI